MAASMLMSRVSAVVLAGRTLRRLGSNVRGAGASRTFSTRVKRNLITGQLFDLASVQQTRNTTHSFSTSLRCLSTQSPQTDDVAPPAEGKEEHEEYHTIIKNKERGRGPADKMEFQAETRKLLDIVARSLYSEKEVFIRELISNASDALEKLRYLQMQGSGGGGSGIIGSEGGAMAGTDTPLEIHIAVDEDKKTFTIQDTGIGMTKQEIIDNLGIIARSGSKAFIEEAQSKGAVDKNIIGQFGVGFYSTFMVGEKVDVYTRSYRPDSVAYKWASDGLGTYELSEAENVERGTKIVVQLRGDCQNFAKEDVIKEVIRKYSNFVGVPIFVNGKKINVIQALWTLEPRDISEDQHEEFYRFISNTFDKPRYSLHYKTDAPINIRALFYVPDYKPTLFDMNRETDVSVTLYSRKVMIVPKASHILPRWLRFMRGVVDSEDIPLNLSRELLQDSSLIRKLRWVLTNRIIKFFLEQSKRDKDKYLDFYDAYGLFFREGIVTTAEQDQREEIAKLLRFESSKLNPGERTNLDEYVGRMKAGSRNVYYLSAPSRELAETSPYMEAMEARDIEVLYCFETYDELVLMNLGQYDKKNLKSVENELVEDKTDPARVDDTNVDSMSQEQADDLLAWLQATLGHRVSKTKLTRRLVSHPCVITVNEMGAARHFLRTALADKSEEEKFRVLQPTLEVNPAHALVRKLHALKGSNPDLARLVAEQVYDNAMIAAGLLEDPRKMLTRLNSILVQALEKH